MTVVTVHQAKTNLSRLLKKASNGEEVIIARGSKPVARLVPGGEGKGKRQPGSFKGELRVRPEFFEPLPPEERSAWGLPALRALVDPHALLWWLADCSALT